MTTTTVRNLAAEAPATSSIFETFIRRYSTAATAALALVVCVTGVMMFFRFYKAEVEAMHEWLGMAFVVAALLHLIRHWLPFKGLMATRRTQILFAVTALVTAAFLVLSPPKADNPVKNTFNAVLQAPLKDVAPVLGLTTESALVRLSEAGVNHPSGDQSLRDLARQAGTSPVKLLTALSTKPAAR